MSLEGPSSRPGVLKSSRERERDVLSSSPLQAPGLKAARVEADGRADMEEEAGAGGGETELGGKGVVPNLPGSGSAVGGE